MARLPQVCRTSPNDKCDARVFRSGVSQKPGRDVRRAVFDEGNSLKRGKRVRGKEGKVPVHAFRHSALFPSFPVPLFPCSPLSLVFLDVISVNPRVLLGTVASFKENLLRVLTSYQTNPRTHFLLGGLRFLTDQKESANSRCS